MDRLSPSQRFKAMSHNRGKGTSIEKKLAETLWHAGYRYRKNYKALPGSPDLALTKHKIAIFCDSEFWHGKDWEILRERLTSGNNPDYWIPKILHNIQRDQEVDIKLHSLGWRTIHFWGKDIQKNNGWCLQVIEEAIMESIAEKHDRLEFEQYRKEQLQMEIHYGDYDKKDPLSIESYGKLLIGMTFQEVLERDLDFQVAEASGKYEVDYASVNNKYAKGKLGNLIEEHHFHYAANSDSHADFPEAGVELKVTPYRINKNGSRSAKERLVLTMIDYMKVIDENFTESHVMDKCSLMLLVFYLYLEGLSRLSYQIDFVQLFMIPKEDLKIMAEDYQTIIDKIHAGRAHELSESDTFYLGACTKGATSKTLRNQPYSSIPAKQRAFCLKTSYMTYILNTYITPGKRTFESIKIHKQNRFQSFADGVTNTINRYRGKSSAQIANAVGLPIPENHRPKNFESTLSFRMLGIRSNRAAEFEKAGVEVKSIRLEPNGDLRETVSFPSFSFIEMAKETWEDADIHERLSNTKYFFVVYQKDGQYESCRSNKDYVGMSNHIHLIASTFWSMPYDDLETEVRGVWQSTVDIINSGIETRASGQRTFNNLPKGSENRVCHIRPHGRDKSDTAPLPNGGSFTKQSFFLNSSYILNEVMQAIQNNGTE